MINCKLFLLVLFYIGSSAACICRVLHEDVVDCDAYENIHNSTRERRWRTPIELAIEADDLDEVQSLLQCGVDVNSRNYGMAYYGCGPLQFAFLILYNQNRPRNKTLEMVDLLLKSGANINQRCRSGMSAIYNRTALILASASEPVEVVRLLLDNGADVNMQGSGGGSALYAAATNHYQAVEVMKVLIDYGADVNQNNPLVEAANRGYLDKVRVLLENGADINLTTEDGKSALHAAAGNIYVDDVKGFIQLLLDNGADVKMTDEDQRTPLHVAVAAENRNIEAVQVLVENGADVNLKAKDGKGVLHAAAGDLYHEKAKESIQQLVEFGADVDMIDQCQRTPLHFAAADNNIEAVQALLEIGADINLRYTDGKGVLHAAATNPYANAGTEMIQLLVENGADVNMTDEHQRTPLHVATEVGNVEAAQALLDAGAENTTPPVLNEYGYSNCDNFFNYY